MWLSISNMWGQTIKASRVVLFCYVIVFGKNAVIDFIFSEYSYNKNKWQSSLLMK